MGIGRLGFVLVILSECWKLEIGSIFGLAGNPGRIGKLEGKKAGRTREPWDMKSSKAPLKLGTNLSAPAIKLPQS